MTLEDSLKILENHWSYDATRRALLQSLIAWHADPELGPRMRELEADLASAAENKDWTGAEHALASILFANMQHGDEDLRIDSLRFLRGTWSRPVLHRAADALLSAPIASASSTAELTFHVWLLRRRGVPLHDTGKLREALAAGSDRARFFAALALAFDNDAERPALVRVARSVALPDGFGEVSPGEYPGDFSCGETAVAWRDPGDGERARYVPTHCRACGSADTDPIHHEILYYSVGIIETLEVRCRVCGWFTIEHFET